MCILAFSSFSAEISELRMQKARMHNALPGSRFLRSSRLAGIASWLLGVSSGWLESFPGWLESLPGWLDSLPG